MNEFILDIEAYLNQEMSPDERQQFEARLAREPELARALRQHQRLLAGLDKYYAQEHAIRAAIGQARTELMAEGFFEQASSDTPDAADGASDETPDEAASTTVVSMRRRWGYLAAAAAVVALLLLVWLRPAPGPDALLATHGQPYPDQLSERLRASQDRLGMGQVAPAQREAILTAMDAYRQPDYAEAQRRLRAYLDQYPAGAYRTDAAFYLAQSALQTGTLDTARHYLSQIGADSRYAQAAAYDQALLLIMQGDTSQARQRLAPLQDDSTYQERVRKLLEQIGQP